MVHVWQQVPFRCIPSTPAANKWTKLGPVIDILLDGLLCHGVVVLAFLQLQVESENKAADVDVQLQLDLNFSAVTGGRYQAARKFLIDASTNFSVAALRIAVEPVRFG
jgi:hypothetical protein